MLVRRGISPLPRGLLVLGLVAAAAGAEPFQVTVASNGFFRVKGVALTNDLAACASLGFRVRGAPGAFEVQLLEADGRAKFWRRVDLAGTHETAVTVPLRFMRRDGSRSPRWDRIRHLALYVRNPGTYAFDGFAFQSQPGTTAELGADELARLAFRGAPFRGVNKAEMIVMTDAPDLDLPKLAAQLDRFVGQARRDMPFLGAPSAPPALLVFARKSDYEEFTPRLAGLLNSSAAPPEANGYTVQAIATSYWEPEKGALRPVYVHEFAHAWFDRVAALPCNAGRWLEEGLASHYQILLHPQEDFAGIVRDGITSADRHLPLRELCGGRRIPLNRYWQALTVVRMLLTAPKYREHLPALLAGGRLPDDDALTRDWLEFCRETWK